MKISVIIVTYNSEKTIGKCLSSVYKSYPKSEVIIVDSFSKDKTLQIARKFPCKIIQLKENVGYGKGNNIGFKEAKGEYVIILNPDIIVENDTIPILLKECKPKTLVSPKVLLKNGKINYFGADINFMGFGTIRHFGEEDRITAEREKTTSITGSCFITRKKDYLWFDDDYFMYNDDTDYSIRALQKGYKIIVTNKAFVTHLHDIGDLRLNSLKYYYDERNRIVTVLKDLPWKNFIAILLFEPVMIVHALLAFKVIERANAYGYIASNFKRIMDKRKAKKLKLGYKLNIEKFIHLPLAGAISFIANVYSYIIYKLLF